MYLTQIYTNAALCDESEMLGQVLCADAIAFDYTVAQMTAADLGNLLSNDRMTSVLDAFKNAAREQKSTVESKISDFDEARIIILDGGICIDGNHHVVAASFLGKSVRFIDLAESDIAPPGIDM